MSTVGNTPIRIMRIIARMNVGGPAVQVSGLLRGLHLPEYEQRLFSGYCEESEADYLKSIATDIEVTRILGFGRRVNLISDITALILLTREIIKFKPHIIHTHTTKAGFLGRIASILSFQPSIRVHTFHGHLLNGYFGRFTTSLIVFCEKSLAVFTHELLAVGDKVREDLLSAGVGKMERFGLMPPGLEIDTLTSKETAKVTLGLSVDKLQCAFIGRVTQIKRPDRFLDVVSDVASHRSDIEFFMVGGGELLEKCRLRIIREDLPVTLLGWQNDMARVLSAADLVLLTSDNEGTPLSLIQAGMAGLPVVSTEVGSVAEIVLNGVTGITTGTNVRDLSQAVQRLASDIGLRSELGSAGRVFTLENFGIERLVNDHRDLYAKLLTKENKG